MLNRKGVHYHNHDFACASLSIPFYSPNFPKLPPTQITSFLSSPNVTIPQAMDMINAYPFLTTTYLSSHIDASRIIILEYTSRHLTSLSHPVHD